MCPEQAPLSSSLTSKGSMLPEDLSHLEAVFCEHTSKVLSPVKVRCMLKYNVPLCSGEKRDGEKISHSQ